MRALNEHGLRAQLKTSVFISVTGNYYLVIVCTQNFSKTVNTKREILRFVYTELQKHLALLTPPMCAYQIAYSCLCCLQNADQVILKQ